jgi:hypothetical protein
VSCLVDNRSILSQEKLEWHEPCKHQLLRSQAGRQKNAVASGGVLGEMPTFRLESPSVASQGIIIGITFSPIPRVRKPQILSSASEARQNRISNRYRRTLDSESGTCGLLGGESLDSESGKARVARAMQTLAAAIAMQRHKRMRCPAVECQERRWLFVLNLRLLHHRASSSASRSPRFFDLGNPRFSRAHPKPRKICCSNYHRE